MCLCAQVLSHFPLFVTLWTVAHQAPLTTGDFPGKNTRVGCHFLLQEIFPTQGSNLHLSLISPALASRFFTTAPSEKPLNWADATNYAALW